MSNENKRFDSYNQQSNPNNLESNLNNSAYLNNININPIQNAITNSLINNPFLMAQISQNIVQQFFKTPTTETNPSGPYESYKTNLISKKRLQMKRQDIDLDDVLIPEDEINLNKNNKKKDIKKIESSKDIKNNDKESDLKEGIYVYHDEIGNKYLYSFHKISNDGTYYELRCKDRTNCKGRAKYIIESGEIQIIQICTINKYEDHNYSQELFNIHLYHIMKFY